MPFPSSQRLYLLVSLGIFLVGFSSATAETTGWLQSTPSPDRYWQATLGGEWDFLSDEGPPLNGTDWQEVHYSIGYVDKSRFALIFSHRIPARTSQFDQVLGLEGYLKVYGPLWLRGLVAPSPDHDFVYRVRTDAELELYLRNLSFGAGYYFLKYNTTDIHTITPFVRFYWRNLQLDFRYLNIFETAADKHFNAFSVRLQNDFDDRWVRPFVGTAVGSRIFGILSLQGSPSQDGFLVYGGNRFGLTPRLDWTLYVSFARENPAFEYIGLGTEVGLKF
ncbi:MAG: hypothetical protein V1495_00220 [Pseudomonadota bacterium]